MEYWKCVERGGDLIWNNDFTFEDCGVEGEGIVRMFSCPNCGAEIEAYIPFDSDNENLANYARA